MKGSAEMRNVGAGGTTHRLRDVFSRVVMPTDALRAEKACPAQTYEDLIQQLVREIDETVLPRVLALLSDERVLAKLVVSNRRLIQLEINQVKVEVGGDGDAAPEAVARAYAHAFKALIARSGPLTVTPVGRAPQTATSSTACSAARLAEFGSAVSFENRLKAFLKLIHAHSQGWIFRSEGGKPVAHDTDAKVLVSLKSLEQQAMTQATGQGDLSRLNRAGPVCALFALSGETQAILASDGQDHLVAAIPQSDVAESLERWQQIYGRPKGFENH